MTKDIILLTKSWKGGGYCVAGIDTATGKWVRILSNNSSTTKQHAVSEEDMKYQNGTSAQVWDRVNIECIGSTPNYYQPENYTMDNGYYWGKLGTADIRNVVSLHPPERHGNLFYNSNKVVDPNEILTINPNERYSLALIKPEEVKICVKRWDDYRPIITALFCHMGKKYQYIKVTDPIFVKQYENIFDGYYDINNVYFVVSLADLNPKDGLHWKLIASVLQG